METEDAKEDSSKAKKSELLYEQKTSFDLNQVKPCL